MSGLDYERVVLAGIGLGVMAAVWNEIMPYMRAQAVRAAHRNFQLDAGIRLADITPDEFCLPMFTRSPMAWDLGDVTRAMRAAVSMPSERKR